MLEVRDDQCPLCIEEIKPGEEVVYSGTTAAHKRCYEREMGASGAPLKDHYRIQRQRLEGLIHEMEPSANVYWDETRSPNFLRFRVEASDGTILLSSSADNHASVIADKSDAELKALISALSGRKLR